MDVVITVIALMLAFTISVLAKRLVVAQTETETADFPSERGICDLCEQRPVAPDDIFCVDCRAETSAMSDEATDPVERMLNQHGRMDPLCSEDKTVCRCGLSFSGGRGYHRRHLAETIYDALGINGPYPWTFGDRSPSRKRFDENGRIMADKKDATR